MHKGQIIILLFIAATLFCADYYIFYGLTGALKKWQFLHKKFFKIAYWLLSIALIAALFLAIFLKANIGSRGAIFLIFFIVWIGKTLFLPFLLADDLRRYWLSRKKTNAAIETDEIAQPPANIIPRSEFLVKAGLIAGSIPVMSLGYGIVSGAYDYQVIYKTLYLPNLPNAFNGLKLAQISDIHSGSFFNKKAVLRGVEMLMREKADLIFFTGDLVNAWTPEMNGYQDIFAKIKAPLGVYSTLGNHDYGDYFDFKTPADKKKDHQDMINIHKNMGWDLLLNANRRLKVDGEEIGILGMENWGSLSRFPRYGRMDLVVRHTEDLPVKLLLSHDPSHWRAQVLPHYPQIDVMFSGHTHGMQFGIRTEHFQWSPIEYVYPEWVGLYRQGAQQLYVNAGFGFIGYPGRIGILPEITIFDLKAGHDPSLKTRLS